MNKKDKYYYDEDAANRAVAFIEKYCTHVKGSLRGKPFILESWQKDEIVKPIFGWKNKETGLRKYRIIYIEIPRKNGKSSICAALTLYIMFSDKERGQELYSCAGDRNQASIIFNICKDMILNNKELAERAKVYRSSIVFEAKGNTYKALSSDSKLQHGHNTHACLFDELHTQKDRSLWDVMLTSTGARTEPLMIALSTAGSSKTNGNICWEIREYAMKVKDNIIEDDTFLPVLYYAEDDMDITLESTWKVANPNYGISISKEYFEQEAKRAIEVASYENTFRRLHLNQWTTSETKWISDNDWTQNDLKYDLKKLEGKECWGGLDLSSTKDLSCLVLIFPHGDDTFSVLPFIWVPERTAGEREYKDKVPYITWGQQGHVLMTDGDIQDYDFIRSTINELGGKYKINSIAFDRWNSSQLVNNLVSDGATMTPYGQGYKSMSAPSKELELLILQKKIRHNNHPVLRWCLSNVQLREDPAGNIKPDKARSTDRIDPIVSLVMALGDFMSDTGPSGSVYDERGLISLG